jgi:hypothetical protein
MVSNAIFLASKFPLEQNASDFILVSNDIYMLKKKLKILFQGKRNKKLFWLPAIAPLVSVILSTFIVYISKADKNGVNIVKHVKRGLNPSSIHQLQLNGEHVGQAAKIGFISAVIALTVC